MLKDYGYVRVGAVVPELKVANTDYNAIEIIKQIFNANEKGIHIVVFPELCISGYTCGDLFFQSKLLEKSLESLEKIINETKSLDIISIIGMPILDNNQLYNVAVLISKGKIIGIIPKTSLSNNNDINEERWFTSGKDIDKEIEILKQKTYFGTNIVFKDEIYRNICLGVEIGEKCLHETNKIKNHIYNGATIILNLSANNTIVGRSDYLKSQLSMLSNINNCAYVYTSSGINESSTDSVFSGQSAIFENGKILVENKRFDFNSNLIYMDIDVNKIINRRIKNKNHIDETNTKEYKTVLADIKDINNELIRQYDKYPFVPKQINERENRCREVFDIQSSGLAKRLKHTNIKKTVIGISGGLDSTLAFIVTLGAYKKLGIDTKNIIAITMPGFGTTKKTYNNAINLVESFNATLMEIDIKKACIQHFIDINHDINNHDITYENSQARERTQILMDIANKENALVIGTGNLSELSLGWCTYNGDHMSMYAVNSSIPKTFISHIIKWFSNDANENQKSILNDILETPISPELLPPDKKGMIKQKTENTIGPYVLHDYFLYYFLRHGDNPSKIFMHAKNTFKELYNEDEIKKYLHIFLKRFFTNQFKRNCMPDGPKIGSVCLSSKEHFKMPSDVDVDIWLKEIENL